MFVLHYVGWILFFVSAVLLTIVVLLQESKGADLAQHARRQLAGERAVRLEPTVLATDSQRRTLRNRADVGEVDRRHEERDLAVVAVAEPPLDGLDEVQGPRAVQVHLPVAGDVGLASTVRHGAMTSSS